MSESLQVTSLVFLQKEDSVLLAMKKRGFGVGLWNGAGGKPELGETIEETAIRECEEEIRVTPLRLSFSGLLSFYFDPAGPLSGKDQQAYTYLCDEWRGQPEESEEMRPEWFSKDKIPYDEMWSYSVLSLPRMLDGERIKASFHFDVNNQVVAHDISPLEA